MNMTCQGKAQDLVDMTLVPCCVTDLTCIVGGMYFSYVGPRGRG